MYSRMHSSMYSSMYLSKYPNVLTNRAELFQPEVIPAKLFIKYKIKLEVKLKHYSFFWPNIDLGQ